MQFTFSPRVRWSALIGGFLLAGQVVAGPVFKAINLGSMDKAGGLTHGYDLNNSGQVTGESYSAEGGFNSHAFLYSSGVLKDLGTLGSQPGLVSYGYGINSNGIVVGNAQTDTTFAAMPTVHMSHGFISKSGVMTDLGTLGGDYSSAMAINGKNQVVGDSTTTLGQDHGFFWSDGKMRDLGTLGGYMSYANDMNDSAQVVGASQFAARNAARHATFWTVRSTGITATDLGTLGGTNSEARRINAAGHVVGYAEMASATGLLPANHAFAWTATGGMVDLGTLGGTDSHAHGINRYDQVVGDSLTTGNLAGHAFFWCRGVMRDLNAMTSLPAGVELLYAWNINDKGQIISQGSDDQAYLLNPATSLVQSLLRMGKCP